MDLKSAIMDFAAEFFFIADFDFPIEDNRENGRGAILAGLGPLQPPGLEPVRSRPQSLMHKYRQKYLKHNKCCTFSVFSPV